MRNLDYAIAYGKLGWPVFPVHSIEDGRCTCGRADCSSPGKHPRTRRGFKEATTSREKIQLWWTESPDANIAVATGAVSGIVVADIDPRNGGDDSWDEFVVEHAPVPETPRSLTGGGGFHDWYKHPGGTVKSRHGKNSLAPGIDLQADGAYVVVPPSNHASGCQYAWPFPSCPPTWPLAPLPEWMLEHNGRKAGPAAAVGERIPEGRRNDTLTGLAGSMRRAGLSEQEMVASLLVVNQSRCDPPLPEAEVRKISASVARYEPRGTDWPSIQTDNRELRDITSDALSALAAANRPHLFVRGNKLFRVSEDEHGLAQTEILTVPALRGEMARAADWVIHARQGVRHVAPSKTVVDDILALPLWPKMPRLKGLVNGPVLTTDKTILTEPGYHAGSGLFYAGQRLELPEIASVAEAVSILRDDLLGDFPFKDEASVAHVIALILLPVVRPIIQGPVPLHAIDAPTPGSGKGLLADAAAIITYGQPADVMAAGRDEEEWRKRITTNLIASRAYVVIDNISNMLWSTTLSMALTRWPDWEDRLLGSNTPVKVPNHTIWVATGNNLSFSQEMVRRVVWIRLVPGVERPWTRQSSEFKHPELLLWVRENRPRLVAAVVKLVAAWLRAGEPAFTGVPPGSFTLWGKVVGGILDVAGVPGFLGNAKELYEQLDPEREEWLAFFGAWWEVFADEAVITATLFDLARDRELLASVLEGGKKGESDQAKKVRLGKAMMRRKEQVLGQWQVVVDGGTLHRARQYRLVMPDM